MRTVYVTLETAHPFGQISNFHFDLLDIGEEANAERCAYGKRSRRDLPNAAIFVVCAPSPWFRRNPARKIRPRLLCYLKCHTVYTSSSGGNKSGFIFYYCIRSLSEYGSCQPFFERVQDGILQKKRLLAFLEE